MKKLSPKIKIGCPRCEALGLDMDFNDEIKLSDIPKNKITSLNPKYNIKKSSKVVSLF